MKNQTSYTLLVLAALLPHVASSAESPIIQPGLYEVKVGIAGNSMSTSTCYREKHTSDIKALILTLEETLMRKDCEVSILGQTNNSADWQLECKSQFVHRTTVGSISWSEGAFRGQAARTMGTIKMDFPFEAKRNGDCK